MKNTKRVKSKIVYPHLGIIDEIAEEVFVREGGETNKDISDVNHSKYHAEKRKIAHKGRETLNRKYEHRSSKKTNGG